MSWSDSQEIDSDLLIFNTDEVNSLSNPLSESSFDHHEMSEEEFGHWSPERELLHSEREEHDFCEILTKTKRKVSSDIMDAPHQPDHLKPSGSTGPQDDDAVDGLLADLQRSHTPTRVPSQASSDGSSLEPLSEAFDVPESLSPSLASRNLSIKEDSRRHSHTFSKTVFESDFGQRLRSHQAMATSPAHPLRSHKRAKSETPSTLNSPTEERKNWMAYDDGHPGHFSHFHLEGACHPRLPVSVPPSPRRAPINLNSPLIADVNVAKSRSEILAHNFMRAIYPSQGTIHKTGDQTLVRRTDENSIGVKLGVDPYGAMILSHTQSRTQERYTAPYLLGSGIETNKLLITMNEDSSLHAGVPPSLAFAILLYLPSESTKAFQADLTLETSVRNEIGASLRKIWASPKVWRLNYDGKSELGCLKMHL
ncbi:hypothetical protein VP01_2658g2 [Puccinia sorghi]|uniref:Uncharacterized protein n=1 Tax=Puccinia sorghi TaxID=27349 RepID=A0A0L6V4S4_9BASI|nr:hypothetical protein VP01_2658g2 [Puccinia sorghi]